LSNRRQSTILIVDDDTGVRETLESILEAEGYSTACAANGKEALDCLQKFPLPCLILLDVVMPVMNG
jgi:CheY-like chemotaxis protein